MTIEIKKEYRMNGDIWFVVYINGAHHKSCLTEEESMGEVNAVKQNLKRPENETIYTETI
jgi:hypothetical protein